jgi:mannose-1-phosphate guanylyltransferase
MKALILAAGKGSRLGASSGGVPKPLVDMGGISPLEHNLRWAAALGPAEIWINVHVGADLIRARIGTDINGIPIHYSHEPELLGTAGAWKNLAGEWTDSTMVIYGDNFMRFDLNALRQAHLAGGAPATIAIYDPDIHANTGIGGGRVALQDGKVTQFVEGGMEGPINAGAYFLEVELLKRVPPGFSDFGRDVLPALAAEGLLAGHLVEPSGYCLGVDTPERLERARRMLDTLELAP